MSHPASTSREATRSDTKEEASHSGSSSILISSFFRSPIIARYLDATLNDPDFPSAVLQRLMQPDDARSPVKQDLQGQLNGYSPSQSNCLQELRSASAANPTDIAASSAAPSDSSQKALLDAIRALTTHLALPSEQVQIPVIAYGGNRLAGVNLDTLTRRCLLGFSHLLLGRWTEAGAELELVRSSLYGQQRIRQKVEVSDSMSLGQLSNDEGQLALERLLSAQALWGLELVAILKGKETEAVRMRDWRRKIQR